ncbi:MAG: chemotaxis protein CheA [Verrucomicrobiota bacterium]
MGNADTNKLERLLDQFAMEIVLTEPGTNTGQLPLRDILFTMEGMSIGNDALKEVYECVSGALVRIDTILDDLRTFNSEDICFFNDILGHLKEMIKKLRRSEDGTETDEPESESTSEPTPEAVNQESQAETPAPASPPPAPPAPATEPIAEEPAPSAKQEEAEEQEEPALEFDPNEDQELVNEFINEATEHLQNIELGVLELEKQPKCMDTLNSIFRAFHTFKGTAGFLNLVPIKMLAHELESLLDLCRQDKLDVTTREIDVILRGGDTLKDFVSEIQQQVEGSKAQETVVIPVLGLISDVKKIINNEPVEATTEPEPAPQSPVVEQAEAPAPEAEAAQPVSETAEAPESPQETVTAADPVTPSPEPEASTAPENAQTEQKPEPAVAKDATNDKKEEALVKRPQKGTRQMLNGSVVKVDTQKLDSLFDLVGELVIAQSLVAQDTNIKNMGDQRISRNLNQLSRIVNDLQKTAMSIRMVPIRATFQKMTRLVRDLAVKQGKEIKLIMSGEETELDRTIVEELADPFLHMVRNSIDHGIETKEERLAANKDPEGTIHLNSFHQGGNIVIQIVDDGKGLDRERILNKAIERGLVQAGEDLPDEEIFKFIFDPGFSTAATITDISGRGVGMDVVRRNIEKLRGKIEIESTPGEGTTFSIYLPLTLAIIEGLIVKVASHKYIIPTLSVRESFRPENKLISTVHERGEMVNVRGRLLPLIRLYDFFDIPPESTDPGESIVIVVESGHQQKCVLVDELVGKQEVVIKSLGDHFKSARALAGAAILGDGQVGLILDASALEHQHGRN